MKLQSLNLLLLVSFFLLILANIFPYKAKGSLPPLEDSPNTFLSGHFPDPFCVLDRIVPFRVDKHEQPPSPHYIDWKETSEEHVITMDVPGLRKDEIKIEVEENGVVRVSSERKKEEKRKDDHWHRVERYYGKFWRQVRLPGNVDLDSVKAKIENGVLTLTLNKFSNGKMKAPRIVSINEEEDDL